MEHIYLKTLLLAHNGFNLLWLHISYNWILAVHE